ncbi:hypothetical protein [Mucilaginibacter panaciglaebae]|uniref:Uncharacterized protein n=1 Tax=Mucilaginibacter panaciglaebae TaxID=502331 RepID=A0ABP7WN07_9SPHI
MKKILLTAVLVISCFAFKADAQLRISLGLNIGSQPDWGPVGYDHAEYYYMPDVDAYYDVPNHQYVYLEGRRWTRAEVLPARYHFDPYNNYKVVVNEPTPWVHAATYRTKYKGYKGRRGQTVIRDSREAKYRNHWNGHDNGNHNGWDKGRGHDDHGRGREDHGKGHDNHGHH